MLHKGHRNEQECGARYCSHCRGGRAFFQILGENVMTFFSNRAARELSSTARRHSN